MTAPFDVAGSERASGPQHLSPQQLATLKALLNQQVALQQMAMAEHDEALDDATDDVVEAAVTVDREFAEALVQLSQQATDELVAALVRIDGGSYGICESCAAAIPFERLEAIPETRYCVRCPRPRSLFS